jgi:hypothetical protein
LKQVTFAQPRGQYGAIALTAHVDAVFSINWSQFPYQGEVPRLRALRRQVGAWFHLLTDCKSRRVNEFLLQNSSLELE